ncbi:MAG: transcriptional repressor LexA [Caldilineaceae bacterium]
MINLSQRQRNILQYIIHFLGEKEYPPTIREIGEKVGISSTSVVNYNLAKLEHEALISRARDVSRGLSVNWDRLIKQGIADELDLEVPAGLRPEPQVVEIAEKPTELFRVPILGPIAAGEPIQVEAIDAASADEFVELTQGILNAPESLFALRVKGDSMIDASVLDGDIVILRHQETAEDGDMVAAWIEGDEETTLKYLYRDGKNVRLQPANPNPAYQPIIRPANKVRINGKVVSVIRVINN